MTTTPRQEWGPGKLEVLGQVSEQARLVEGLAATAGVGRYALVEYWSAQVRVASAREDAEAGRAALVQLAASTINAIIALDRSAAVPW